MLSRSVVSDSVTLWTVALQAPLSMLFSRQGYWSGLPCPAVGDRPYPGIKPTSLPFPAWAGRVLTSSTTYGEKYAKKFSSVTQSCPTLCDTMAARQASPSITNSQSLFRLMSVELVMPKSMWSQTE